jgi:H+/Cl- antiporter ClcA
MQSAPQGPQLADFSASPRLVVISGIAVAVGVIAASLALILLRLIAFFTNAFYFHRISIDDVAPADAHLGPWSVLVPVAGGLIIGLMARYGSDRIRGHGIPEALEAILINRSLMQPRVAILKPLSSAISIGSGGPFGAEGPIIMTGGAFGSVLAQHLHLTNIERRTLLVAGAAAGMSATFAAPLAAILLAVELLLFEWRPRSIVPVALASATAAAVRHYIIGAGPLFPIDAQPSFPGAGGLAACLLVGVLAGGLSLLLTSAVYVAEDAFARVRVHWMWWPAIGGIVIGIGGLIYAPALGVGYQNIEALLGGDDSVRIILGILIVKAVIWAAALGSGTSGGVLAPLLMMGAALGALEGHFLPAEAPGFWPLVSMAAVLGGTMRSPLTSIVFAIELTHNFDMMYPIALASFVAFAFTVIVMKRSILTEKVARRGFHISREYSADPLELMLVREAMTAVAIAGAHTHNGHAPSDDADGHIAAAAVIIPVSDDDAPHAFPGEPVRTVLHRMLDADLTVIDVKDPATRQTVGRLSLSSILEARQRIYDEEHKRERMYTWRSLVPRRAAPAASSLDAH